MHIRMDSASLLEQLATTEGQNVKSLSYIKKTLGNINSKSVRDNAVIFIRGCRHIIQHIEELNQSIQSGKVHAEKEKKVHNCKQILKLYLSYFAVCEDAAAVEFANLMFERFTIINHQLHSYALTDNDEYANTAITFLDRAANTLQRFVDNLPA